MLILDRNTPAEAERRLQRLPVLQRYDLAIITHPLRYLRWRRDVARNGPYAAAWEGPEPRIAAIVLALIPVVAILAAITLIAISPG